MQKIKVYSGYFTSLFSHFAPGLALMQKVKGFCGLVFRGINKTRNSHEMRKVCKECFVFCGVFHENIRQKCITGLRSTLKEYRNL